ncbi:hypothetical protein KSF_038700 [Reticulibacter mediterranei]|uniref:Uncharacterized protein n=1 Tax=Reticulibacter mediterranei TaxID=2778369 RepID=A0A8J3IMA7_9CHLR|nr:hypothetical protein [Reticulibacter mediterranei]GHO93822.1 hypothetical protein KSF_038700 [Reticulibacter mediterranei]
MLQDRMTQAVARQGRRLPLPILPTLVICVGKYGQEVGRQLAVRLSITERGLKEQGLTHPLLVRANEAGEIQPGLVRIMGLDWDRWFLHQCTPASLLFDIDNVDIAVLDEETPPQIREEDRHPDDWVQARSAFPATRERLRTVALPLYMHNTPLQMGNFQTQGLDQDAQLRIAVICAAREAATCELVPDFLRLLGQLYVQQDTLIRGIQVFCYVGSTSREEHLRAGGDESAFSQLEQNELARLIPVQKRPISPPGVPPPPDSFLDKLNQLWQEPGPQLLSSCYLIDTQLANNVVPVRLWRNEPDETIVGTALALNMCIASNSDLVISSLIPTRWGERLIYSDPGPFATFGVASCSLDYPQLYRLIYGNMIGTFLQRVQPTMHGDHPDQAAGEHADKLVNEPLLDARIDGEVQTHLEELRRSFNKKQIQATLPELSTVALQKTDYRATIQELLQLNPLNRTAIKETLARFSMQFANKLRRNNLLHLYQERQRRYLEALQAAMRSHHTSFLHNGEAAFTAMYRFVPESLRIVIAEARKAEAPYDVSTMETQQQEFADRHSTRYQQNVIEHITNIQYSLKRAPGRIGITGRALLLLPLSVLLSLLISKNNILAFAIVGLILALPLYALLSLIYRSIQNKTLEKPLRQMKRQYDTTIAELDRQAWSWALAQMVKETDALTQRITLLASPAGILSETRDRLLAEQVHLQERVLERVLFDETLRQELHATVRQFLAHNYLWEQRQSLSLQMLRRSWSSQEELEEWLFQETQEYYHTNWHSVVAVIEQFLRQASTAQLEQLWQDLSNAAVPLLRRTIKPQDDPSVHKAFLALHHARQLPNLAAIVSPSGTQVLESTDQARWLFMRVTQGLHLAYIIISAEALL